MLQKALKIGLIVAVLGIVVKDASAFGRCGRGCGWGGGWCCGYGGCGYGGGYAYGGYGYGGYYAGYGGYGYGGYYASSNSSYSSPAVPAATRLTVASAQAVSNSLQFTVNVPVDAKVFVNGQLTTSKGERRQYTSKDLQPGSVYAYRVRAEYVRDGKPVSEEKTVELAAGQTASLAFKSAAPNAQLADMVKSAQR